jgi:hypothetical protein
VEEAFVEESGLLAFGEAGVADADFVGADFGAGGSTMGHGKFSKFHSGERGGTIPRLRKLPCHCDGGECNDFLDGF